MLLKKPYFSKNKEWYIEHKGLPSFLGGKVKRQYTLTDKAPQKAIDSYNEYYEDEEDNKIFSMGDCFNVEYIRKNLIEELKKQGYPQEKIDELIKICDTAYNDYKIPYPTIDELLKDAE